MKATKKDRENFLKNYLQCQVDLGIFLDQYKRDIYYIISEHDFENNIDLVEFAKEAFYRKAKEFCDQKFFEHVEMFNMIQRIKKIE